MSATIMPSDTGSDIKKCSTNHTAKGQTMSLTRLRAYSLGCESASLTDTGPSDMPTHIMLSGTVAAARVPHTSSMIVGTGMRSVNISVAKRVAIIGIFIAFLILNPPFSPLFSIITPTVYSSRLKGILSSDAKNSDSSPYSAVTTGKPTKALFINATSSLYIPRSPVFMPSSVGVT